MSPPRLFDHNMVLDLYAEGHDYKAIMALVPGTTYSAVRGTVYRAAKAGEPRAARFPRVPSRSPFYHALPPPPVTPPRLLAPELGIRVVRDRRVGGGFVSLSGGCSS